MAISMSLIKELKDMTGAGIVDCKAVLTETDGDLDKAVEILRKKGMAKAAKKAGRTAKEGLVLTRISDDHKKGVIVKVNCETDFVSATEDFKNFANDVLENIWENEYDWSKGAELPEALEALRTGIVGKLGENILISEWSVVKDATWIYEYTHANKIGVLVDFSADAYVPSDEESETFMKNIAMQIVAMNPMSVKSSDMPADEVAKEKEIYLEEARKTGKPENILEKIIEGKMRKFYEENVLLQQVFMLDEEGKNTIADVIMEYSKSKGVNAMVESFVRVAL